MTGLRNGDIRWLIWDCFHWNESELLKVQLLRSERINVMNVRCVSAKTGQEHLVPM